MAWQILPEGTTAGMSIAQNLALTGVILLAAIGFMALLETVRR